MPRDRIHVPICTFPRFRSEFWVLTCVIFVQFAKFGENVPRAAIMRDQVRGVGDGGLITISSSTFHVLVACRVHRSALTSCSGTSASTEVSLIHDSHMIHMYPCRRYDKSQFQPKKMIQRRMKRKLLSLTVAQSLKSLEEGFGLCWFLFDRFSPPNNGMLFSVPLQRPVRLGYTFQSPSRFVHVSTMSNYRCA